jgi:mevalonate kinase
MRLRYDPVNMAVASGKVILLGEHAVVYGHPAIVAGIENGAEASATIDGSCSITVGNQAANSNQGTLGVAFSELMSALNTPPLRAKVQLNIPPGCGLGASAAAAVALARAALDLLEPAESEPPVRRKSILRAANAWEKVFHGNPSGVDATAATIGGCFAFDRRKGPESLTLQQSLQLGVAIADAPAETRAIVARVAEMREEDSRRINGILEQIADLVAQARLAMLYGAAARLGQLMNANHALLQQLEVSTPRLDQACALALQAGALGAKLTGSGGGGCVIALCDGSADPVLEAWRGRSLSCFSVTIHASA